MLGLNHEGLKFIVIRKFSKKNSRIILYENAICHMFYLSKVLLFKISSYHDIAEILLNLALNTNQSIDQAGRSHYQLAAVLHVFPEPVK